MVIRRYQQRSIYEELVKNMLPDHEAIQWEEWLVKVDQALEDSELLDLVQEALAQRYPRSKNRGRPGTPAEVALRLLLLKHLKNWSYAELEREVRANLVYRQFTRIGLERVPDEKTMVRLGQALGPVTKQLHERVVLLAATKKVARGRKLRVDTTVTEKNIRYPTDSQLLGDGIRVITRTIEKLKTVAGAQREPAAARDFAGRAATRRSGKREAATQLRQAAAKRATRSRSGRAGRAAVSHQGQTDAEPEAKSARRGPGPADHRDDCFAAPGDSPNQSPRVRRRLPLSPQSAQHLRARYRSHPQRESREADGVWQAGQDPGSGKPAHCGLRSLR